MMLGAGAAFSTVLTAFRYTNGFAGSKVEYPEEEEVERRERLKKNRRQPLSETIQQLGEGRGTLLQDVDDLNWTDCVRNLRSGPRREEARAHHGQVWHRREGCPGDELDASVLCLRRRADGRLKPSIESSSHFELVCIYPKCQNVISMFHILLHQQIRLGELERQSFDGEMTLTRLVYDSALQCI
jgi:hypothetical protein